MRRRGDGERDQIRRAFLGLALCHELKQPLHSLNLNIELLSKRVAKQAGDGGTDVAGPMKALGRVVDRINDTLEMFSSRAMPDPVPSEPMAIAPLLVEAVERAQPRARGAGVSLVLKPASLPEVAVHPEQLAVALDALIDNALRASKAGGHVVVAAGRADDDLRIEVIDDGVGMTPEVARRAVEIGFSTWGGQGVGLTVAKFITYHHAGGFQITSTPGHGTNAAMILPISDVRD
jgi:signal transduction histidine kinase